MIAAFLTILILYLLLAYVIQPLRRALGDGPEPFQPLARVSESAVCAQFGHFAGRIELNLSTAEALFLLRRFFLNNATQQWNGGEVKVADEEPPFTHLLVH